MYATDKMYYYSEENNFTQKHNWQLRTVLTFIIKIKNIVKYFFIDYIERNETVFIFQS